MMKVYRWYRLSRRLYLLGIPILPKAITILIRIIFSAMIPASADIGKCSFGYGGLGTVIHSSAKIGHHVVIGTNVTIGGKSEKTKGEVPCIGNHVYISSGTIILGGVKIGDNTMIGANSVVTRDIPSNCIAVGSPARVIKRDIDIEEYVDFSRFFKKETVYPRGKVSVER